MDTAVQVHRVDDTKEENVIGNPLPPGISANISGEFVHLVKNTNLIKQRSQVRQVQNSAQPLMNNESQNIMQFSESHDWYGTVIGKPPPPGISANSSGTFVHLADPINGSKGAVVYYAHINPTTECAWLLAWFAPVGTATDPPKNQVYVETGKNENYKNIDWAAIEGKLNLSNTMSSYQDPITGSVASAEIFQNGSTAMVAARFY